MSKPTTNYSTSHKEIMSFPDFDSEWDDELPTILQVLEGIEVEEMPDIYVEREFDTYIPTMAETTGANRFLGLNLTPVSAGKMTAEMESADNQSAGMRVVQYKPLEASIAILQDFSDDSNDSFLFCSSPPSSSSSSSPSRIKPTTRIKPMVASDEALPVEFPRGLQVKMIKNDIALTTEIPKSYLDAKPATDKDPHGTATKIVQVPGEDPTTNSCRSQNQDQDSGYGKD